MVQLPGVNAAQFTWGRTKLPKPTMPVPPMYQPQVAADTVHYAAHHRPPGLRRPVDHRQHSRRAHRPWALDLCFAKPGYSSQMTDYELEPTGHDNLVTPVDENHGARGPFDSQAHEISPTRELSKRRSAITAAAVAAGMGLAGAVAVAARHAVN